MRWDLVDGVNQARLIMEDRRTLQNPEHVVECAGLDAPRQRMTSTHALQAKRNHCKFVQLARAKYLCARVSNPHFRSIQDEV